MDVGNGLENPQAALCGQVEERAGLLHGGGERLLEQDVLAGKQGLPGGLEMQGIRQGDIDEVDVRAREHFSIVRINVGDAETAGLFAAAAADGDDFIARNGLHGFEHLGDDPSGSDNGDSDHNNGWVWFSYAKIITIFV